MTTQISKKGRPKKVMNLSLLADANYVNEPSRELVIATCNICGSTKDVIRFKHTYICMKCVNLAKKMN